MKNNQPEHVGSQDWHLPILEICKQFANKFNAEIINDADKMAQEVSRYGEIPIVHYVTQQQVLDIYYQVKMDVKRLIGSEVERLKGEKEGLTLDS